MLSEAERDDESKGVGSGVVFSLGVSEMTRLAALRLGGAFFLGWVGPRARPSARVLQIR